MTGMFDMGFERYANEFPEVPDHIARLEYEDTYISDLRDRYAERMLERSG